MTLIHGEDIVIVGLQPWDTEIGSNCKNIALEFSKNNRVLYVNSPLDRSTTIRKRNDPGVKVRLNKLRENDASIEIVSENLWVYYPGVILESINWIKIDFLFDLLNRRNNRIFADSIMKAVKQLDFGDFILFNDNDIFRSFYLKELLNPKVSVYYSRDYLLGVDYWKYHGKRLEPILMAKSDICVANSSHLAKICSKYNSRSYDIGQGCELDLFFASEFLPTPADMITIAHPVIGYVGALDSLRLDLELLVNLALQKPEWSIVLMGPEDFNFTKSKLHDLPNVHFLGSKHPSLLPQYINACDVCINPQSVNDVTIGNYPRKVDEYLAAGKPVVAILTDTMLMFSNYVYLAKSSDLFVELISKALIEDNNELALLRKQFASSHTWENSVGKIYSAIITNLYA